MVLTFSTVAAEEMPPEPAADLAFKGGEVEAGTVAVGSWGLGYTDGETL